MEKLEATGLIVSGGGGFDLFNPVMEIPDLVNRIKLWHGASLRKKVGRDSLFQNYGLENVFEVEKLAQEF